MPRQSFVIRDGKLVPKETAAPRDGVYFVPDIKPFRTQDGVEISSRSHLRRYEIANGVRQCGNDLKVPWNND